MLAMSFLQIPEYKRKQLKRGLMWISIDYRRFSFTSRKVLDGYIQEYLPWYFWCSDSDNSSFSYQNNALISRVASPRGTAYQVIIAFENIWPVPIIYFEFYKEWLWMKDTVWRIDFYGSFFHFEDYIDDKYKELYKKLHSGLKNKDSRSTRVDVAFDFTFPFPQDTSWIVPSKNSDREVSFYKHENKINSIAYLSWKNSWYGVRIYNKNISVAKTGKENWYWWKEAIGNDWTRIEFEFYPPYSPKTDEEIIAICSKKLLNDETPNLNLKYRPNFVFNVENAYKYFERYAKNHGMTMNDLLDCLMEVQINMDIIEYEKSLTKKDF